MNSLLPLFKKMDDDTRLLCRIEVLKIIRYALQGHKCFEALKMAEDSFFKNRMSGILAKEEIVENSITKSSESKLSMTTRSADGSRPVRKRRVSVSFSRLYSIALIFTFSFFFLQLLGKLLISFKYFFYLILVFKFFFLLNYMSPIIIKLYIFFKRSFQFLKRLQFQIISDLLVDFTTTFFNNNIYFAYNRPVPHPHYRCRLKDEALEDRERQVQLP